MHIYLLCYTTGHRSSYSPHLPLSLPQRPVHQCPRQHQYSHTCIYMHTTTLKLYALYTPTYVYINQFICYYGTGHGPSYPSTPRTPVPTSTPILTYEYIYTYNYIIIIYNMHSNLCIHNYLFLWDTTEHGPF